MRVFWRASFRAIERFTQHHHRRSGRGSVTTKLGRTGSVVVNEKSSLHRQWFTLNDTSAPATLNRSEIETNYYSDSGYMFRAHGVLEVSAGISAIELIAVTFDLWGEQQHSLRFAIVQDFPAGAVYDIPEGAANWKALERDVKEFLSCVIFIRTVRLSDGRIWNFDDKAVAEKLAALQFRLALADLSPKPKPK